MHDDIDDEPIWMILFTIGLILCFLAMYIKINYG